MLFLGGFDRGLCGWRRECGGEVDAARLASLRRNAGDAGAGEGQDFGAQFLCYLVSVLRTGIAGIQSSVPKITRQDKNVCY